MNNGGQRTIAEGPAMELSSDFDLWYNKKAIILPRFNRGVRMCKFTDGSDSLPLGCRCAYSCPANTFEQLDSTDTSLDFHVALDWIHGKYYWAGRRFELGAVGVYDVATKRRRVLFSGLRSHIHPEKIAVDPIDLTGSSSGSTHHDGDRSQR